MPKKVLILLDLIKFTGEIKGYSKKYVINIFIPSALGNTNCTILSKYLNTKPMNKYLLIFCLILLLGFQGMAQLSVGGFGGITSINLKGDAPDNASYKSIIGFSGGIQLDLKLSETVSLSFQPSYLQQGTKIQWDIDGLTEPLDSIDIKLNYYALPLFLKASTNNKRFYAVGGIETAFYADSKISSKGEELDIDLNPQKIDVSMIFGVGFRIPIGRPVLWLEARYGQGLINVTDRVGVKDYIPRVKSTGYRLLAGIQIPLTKN